MEEDKELNSGCAHRNDLIAIVYGEATEMETRSFQRHMNECAECSDDYSAFKGIRNSVFSWRQETLGFVAQPEHDRLRAERSALAALREFFTLSPLWLKGAIALASLVFCLLAVLAVVRFRPDTKPVVATSKTDAEIERLVEARTQERLAALKKPDESNPEIATDSLDESKPEKSGKRKIAVSSKQVAVNPTRRPLTKLERDQLAADLRLTASEEESEIDLLGEGNNRQY